MIAVAELEQSIERLMEGSTYAWEPADRKSVLLEVLQQELAYACQRNPCYHNYANHWPIDFQAAESITDLPYLPVAVFKADPPLSLVPAGEIKRTLSSSATTGQVPSRVVLDSATGRRMTKGLTAIIRDFVGPSRRPYLIVDTAENVRPGAELGARGAAIQGLGSFATEMVCCLGRDQDQNLIPDFEKLLWCSQKWKDTEVLVYGFTYVIWTHLVLPMQRQGLTLGLRNVHILHSGGWKRLQEQAVTKDVFIGEVASLFGCSPDRIIDYYGMVENVGVVYPDCEHGNKHVPAFAEVIIRDPLTLAAVKPGEQGLIQVCSVLPTSFPGFLVLTDDMAQFIDSDGCACGRRGTHFRFAGRVPKAEARGCGNLEVVRYRIGE